MSTALRITHGAFGRVALLDMDRSLVRHAHPHCHVLIKADGADTQFAVRDKLVELTDSQAVLINTWEPHAYVHYKERPRTIILALYIEPEWMQKAAHVTVTAWAMDGFTALLVYGGGLADVWRPAAALAAMGAAFLAAGWWRFSRKERFL